LLYVVATPIGNLGDITARALEVLGNVDVIAAEDTRRARLLLSHFNISKPMVAYHDHSDNHRVDQLMAELAEGKNVALLSDAGTPLVSDPGYRLVRRALEEGMNVTTLPGACAAIAALSMAGLPSDRFVFEGFLPSKAAARRAHLESLKQEPRTLIFYESPRRIQAMLSDVVEVMGAARELVVTREITKTHETLLRGTAADVLHRVSNDPEQQLGEIVVLIHGAGEDADADATRAHQMMGILVEQMPVKTAAKVAEQLSGLPRNLLYKTGLALTRSDD